jgi:hypothetical protein
MSLSYTLRLLAGFVLAASIAHACAAERPVPIQLGGDKQLFIDEMFFAQKQGVLLVVNQPVKDPRPVIVADKDRPWELNRISSGSSVIDDGGEVKIYYDAIAPTAVNQPRSRWLCYAVSKDGIHFEKPKLGIVPFEGRNDTNIVWPPKHDPSHEPGNVFIDTNPKCPLAERYKLVCTWHGKTWMAFSADGLHWKPYDRASFRGSDTTNAAYFDNRIGRYVGWVRTWDNNLRKVGRCEFDDPNNWGTETTVFSADSEDQRYLNKGLFREMDHYCGAVNVYRPAPGVYFGFPAAYYHFHKEVSLHRGRGGSRNPHNDGNVEPQLMTSRDSIHWYRPERAKPFIPRGPQGSWDWGMVYVSGGSNLVYRGDEVWIYYAAQPFTHGDYSAAEREALGSVMRAVLRVDGFVSVDAGFRPGEFTTPPMVFAGKHLALNVDTGGGGHLLVELQDAAGKPLGGYALTDCDAVNSNRVDQRVSWKGRSDLSALTGKPVRMRVQMRMTKLYAFQFVSD